MPAPPLTLSAPVVVDVESAGEMSTSVCPVIEDPHCRVPSQPIDPVQKTVCVAATCLHESVLSKFPAAVRCMAPADVIPPVVVTLREGTDRAEELTIEPADSCPEIVAVAAVRSPLRWASTAFTVGVVTAVAVRDPSRASPPSAPTDSVVLPPSPVRISLLAARSPPAVMSPVAWTSSHVTFPSATSPPSSVCSPLPLTPSLTVFPPCEMTTPFMTRPSGVTVRPGTVKDPVTSSGQ